MRRAAVTFAAALVTLSLSAALAAPQEKWARGKVTAMAGNTVTIDVKGQPMTFTVEPSTHYIARGGTTMKKEAERTGAKITLADVVKVGDNVEINYVESGGTMLAKTVRVGISAPAGTSTEAAAAASKRLDGVVSEISGSSLTVKPATGAAVTFVVEPNIPIVGQGLGTLSKEKQAKDVKLTLSDAVAVGDTVRVTYKVTGDSNHATNVRVIKKKTT
jgi:Domain of unknown function (DUF5666)